MEDTNINRGDQIINAAFVIIFIMFFSALAIYKSANGLYSNDFFMLFVEYTLQALTSLLFSMFTDMVTRNVIVRIRDSKSGVLSIVESVVFSYISVLFVSASFHIECDTALFSISTGMAILSVVLPLFLKKRFQVRLNFYYDRSTGKRVPEPIINEL